MLHRNGVRIRSVWSLYKCCNGRRRIVNVTPGRFYGFSSFLTSSLRVSSFCTNTSKSPCKNVETPESSPSSSVASPSTAGVATQQEPDDMLEEKKQKCTIAKTDGSEPKEKVESKIQSIKKDQGGVLGEEFGFKYQGQEPTIHGDWQHKGRVSDF